MLAFKHHSLPLAAAAVQLATSRCRPPLSDLRHSAGPVPATVQARVRNVCIPITENQVLYLIIRLFTCKIVLQLEQYCELSDSWPGFADAQIVECMRTESFGGNASEIIRRDG